MVKIIVVDGNIAAGKSTFIQIIKNHLQSLQIRVCVIKEPVKLWEEVGILEQYYNDPERYGYSFQTFVFVTRIKEALRKYKKHGNNVDVYLLERSWYTDLIFAKANENNMTPIERRMYKEWADFHKESVPFKITTFVHLRCPASVSYQRCLKRARKGENVIKQEYLEQLLQAHDEMFMNPPDNANCLVYDSTDNFVENSEKACAWFVNTVLAFGSERHIHNLISLIMSAELGDDDAIADLKSKRSELLALTRCSLISPEVKKVFKQSLK